MLTCKQAVMGYICRVCFYGPNLQGGALLNSLTICPTPRAQVQVQSQATMAPAGELPTHELLPRVNCPKYRLDWDKSNARSIQLSFTRTPFCQRVCVQGCGGNYSHYKHLFHLPLPFPLSIFLPLFLSHRL